MISRMQLPREMYGNGGLTSLREARTVLERHAPRGEFLAYINSDEAALLKNRGGSGEVANESGIKSYRSLRKTFNKLIPKEITRTLDKIVPNEIKPYLPYIAAAVPFMLPTTGLFASSMARALAGAGANAFSQLSQEGAEKYGINPISVGLSGLSGYLSAPGTGGPSGDLASGKIVGNIGDKAITAGDFATQFPGYTGPKTLEALSQMSDVATTGPTFLQGAENIARGVGQYGADTFQKGQTAFDKIASGDIMDIKLGDVGNIAKAAGPSVIGAAGDQAYLDASKALEDYNKQQQAMGQLGVANTEARKAAIRRAMGLSGYTPEEIENTILKFKFADGGRVGYQEGGLGSMDPMLALQRSPFDYYGFSDPVISALTGNVFTSGQRFRDVTDLSSGPDIQRAQSLGYSQPEIQELGLQRDMLADYRSALSEASLGPTFQANPEKTALDLANSLRQMYMNPTPSVQQSNQQFFQQPVQQQVVTQQPQMSYNEIQKANYARRMGELEDKFARQGTSATKYIQDMTNLMAQMKNSGGIDPLGAMQSKYYTGPSSGSVSEGRGIDANFVINRAQQAEREAASRVAPRMADGGLMNLRMGGMPAEMDLRKGGFVPLGVKEKADDVPARLSKNEFVFTAKAVRNAGGGDVRKGAKRMYQIMNQLEARS